VHEYRVAFVGRSGSIALQRFSSAIRPASGNRGSRLTMPAPQRNHVQVVRCKVCKRCVPISVEAVIGSVTVACPLCMERRSYIVSTEVFLGQPSWEVMRVFQGRR
jgi:hypothetical protein